MEIPPCRCNLDPNKGGVCEETGMQLSPHMYKVCQNSPEQRMRWILESEEYLKEHPYLLEQISNEPKYADLINRALGKNTISTFSAVRHKKRLRIKPCNYLGKQLERLNCSCTPHQCNLHNRETIKTRRLKEYMSCLDCDDYISGRKIVISTDRVLAPGDTVGLLLAITNLGLWGDMNATFKLGDRVVAPELGMGNPFIDQDIDPRRTGVESYEVSQHKINESNKTNTHLAEAWLWSLCEKLGLNFRPITYTSCIYMTERELKEPPVEPPYVLINCSHKQDNTTKQWPPEHWQKVVNYINSRGAKVVRVGEVNGEWHVHPPVDGVVDMVGKTGPPLCEDHDYRPLISLVYHSAATISHLSYLMHLGAMVPTPNGGRRPVLALNGGREPIAWSQYPGSHLFHSIGSMPCCNPNPCWVGRVVRIEDGEAGHNSRLCDQPEVMGSGTWARCQQMITPEEVIQTLSRVVLNGIPKHDPITERR